MSADFDRLVVQGIRLVQLPLDLCVDTLPTVPRSSCHHAPCLPSTWPFTSRGGNASCYCLSLGALPTLFGAHWVCTYFYKATSLYTFQWNPSEWASKFCGLIPRGHGAGGRQAHLELRRAKVPAVWICWGTLTYYIITSSVLSHNLTHTGFLCIYGWTS